MANIKIAFINQSTVVTDAEAQKVIAALQKQVKQDYAPAWGTDADLFFYNDPKKVPADYWWLVILDTSDEADALGYHDLTDRGLPMGKIFAKSDIDYNSAWSVTASHELLEMMEDPNVNLMVYRLDENQEAYLISYEVCDACEADKFGYKIDGVLVSDFVYPSWFEDYDHPKGTKYDKMGLIKKPFQLLAEGYIGVNKLDTFQGWSQIYGDTAKRTYRMRPYKGSRRERRSTERVLWLKSVPKSKVKRK